MQRCRLMGHCTRWQRCELIIRQGHAAADRSASANKAAATRKGSAEHRIHHWIQLFETAADGARCGLG
ncbi:hypothetical protein F3Y30_21955 (plasmid) [Sinorhizobium sp. BG8]|nr:hypothetical protein F3Y30_21955 [Sinorhizobium sp. BG8]